MSGMQSKIEEMARLNAERVAKIEEMLQLDAERVAKIEEMLRLDAERVVKIEELTRLDAERVTKIKEISAFDVERVDQIDRLSGAFFEMDGMSIAGRNLDFLDAPGFAAAWKSAASGNAEGWPHGVPDIRWRAHIALWAAQHALKLEGDFVECGVHTGLLSLMICHALDFGRIDRRFYLYDTYAGIPLDDLEGPELDRATEANAKYYKSDVFAIAKRNFSPFANVHLIRGVLPQALSQMKPRLISYLSIDLNNAKAEEGVIRELWDLLVPGACVVIDDYAFIGHERQFTMWNRFAAEKNVSIGTLPTGQGLIITPRVTTPTLRAESANRQS